VGSYIDKARAELVSNQPIKRRKVGKYKGQEQLTRILESIFGMSAETEKTFPWLISPRGARLRVDIYFTELNIAVEYHGKQHAEFPNAFHKTAEDFRYAAMCDAWKITTLRQHGIRVLEFTYKDKLTKQHVLNKLRKLEVLPRGLNG
jgi:hypothetical protein